MIELEIAYGVEAEAMRRVREKGCADKHANGGATLIAIAVDREKRRVGEYVIERLTI